MILVGMERNRPKMVRVERTKMVAAFCGMMPKPSPGTARRPIDQGHAPRAARPRTEVRRWSRRSAG